MTLRQYVLSKQQGSTSFIEVTWGALEACSRSLHQSLPHRRINDPKHWVNILCYFKIWQRNIDGLFQEEVCLSGRDSSIHHVALSESMNFPSMGSLPDKGVIQLLRIYLYTLNVIQSCSLGASRYGLIWCDKDIIVRWLDVFVLVYHARRVFI